jgi:transcriptional regulator with XRE-family HTH domain
MSNNQPAYDLLKARGFSVATAAETMGVSYTHLRDALSGRVRPRPELIAELEHFLKTDKRSLFTADRLSKPYQRRRALRATVAA